MKRVIVATDSFKGCLTSAEIGRLAARGIHEVFPHCKVTEVPVADGGEGTVEALVHALAGRIVEVEVAGPLMLPVLASYGLSGDGTTAIMEMASASGLPLVPEDLRNPLKTTTRGTGEMILDALRRGCRRVLIGIGGSATNDGGLGMLRTLGFRFYDDAGAEIEIGRGEDLERVVRMDSSQVAPEVFATEFVVVCDVNNPFYGPEGAARVYARQKGADDAMIERLDAGLRKFAEAIARSGRPEIDNMPGAGAAGGLGGAFVAFLNATLKPGIEMVLDAINFDKLIEGADLIITGEGKLDSQTAMGKTPQGVLERAQRQGIPVIAIGGAVEDATSLNDAGFAGVFSIQPGPVLLERAMEPGFASANIVRTVTQIMRLFAIKQTV